ncbi:MAG: HvfX family Cu-binding RiPP maturation protein [Shewanella sp.]
MGFNRLIHLFNQAASSTQGLALLGLRVYLAPVLIQAGYNKLSHFSDTAAWFGNAEWGLGLPMPEVMAGLAAGTEFFGGILLLLGLATRLVALPMMITMAVAAVTVHWQHGWLAISDPSSWLANEQVLASAEKLAKAKELLQQHGDFEWLTSSGNFVVLNNGIEFAATYFLMLLVLFSCGGGKGFSVDYYLAKGRQQV